MDISKRIIMLEVKLLNADVSVCDEYVRMTEVKSSNADVMVLNEYICTCFADAIIVLNEYLKM